MLFQLLLPLAAICLVMAILKININPTSPSIVLNFADLLQQDPIITASPPQYMAPCFRDWEAVHGSSSGGGTECAGGLQFRCAFAQRSVAHEPTNDVTFKAGTCFWYNPHDECQCVRQPETPFLQPAPCALISCHVLNWDRHLACSPLRHLSVR